MERRRRILRETTIYSRDVQMMECELVKSLLEVEERSCSSLKHWRVEYPFLMTLEFQSGFYCSVKLKKNY